MSMQDPIADMFTRLRNAQMVAKKQVVLRASKLKTAIAKVLKDEGYITAYEIQQENGKNFLVITLKYYQGKPVISSIKRVSRPGIRIYRTHEQLPKIMGGLGMAIVSTPKGVMSDRAARIIKQGGEILGEVA